MRKYFVWILLFFVTTAQAQQLLKPGFDADEYADLLFMNFYMMNKTAYVGKDTTMLKGSYRKLYQSPEVGLYNRVELFKRSDGVGIISLRGTVMKTESWLENFHAAMIRANGSWQINDSTVFKYQLAADSNAYVHAGWMIGLAHLAPIVLQQMAQQPMKEWIIMGHSQGGALAFLMTSYLHYYFKQQQQSYHFKAYFSAAPKPGNQVYAYDLEHITRDGWGFRVVNSADWVPETPFTIQKVEDMNAVNPFANITNLLGNVPFFTRVGLNYAFNRMRKGTTKATRINRKYLGNLIYPQINKTLPQLRKQEFVYSSQFMTAGTPVILMANKTYLDKYPFDGKNLFIHHMYQPYLDVLRIYYPAKK